MKIRTKKNKSMNCRRAATQVLNQMQGGRWISGIGRVALTAEEDASAMPSYDRGLSMNEQNSQAQRKRISTQLTRGQRLSTRIVKELGLGILFSPKIW